MSVASDMVLKGELPEDNKNEAILIIRSLPLNPQEKKYLYLDYTIIFGIKIEKKDITAATGDIFI